MTDAEIQERFYQDGNNEWLGILLQRYTLLLYGVCMKYIRNEDEAKDAVQQIFLKAITELQKYRVDYFKSWLYMMARNHCLMKLRDKGKATVEIRERMATVEPEEEGIRLNHLHKDRILNLLAEALEELNPEQKRCISLFYLEKRSYQEIATISGLSLMQVKSCIQNGKRNLKISLEKRLKDEGA
jgi:RNA polymerase sigma factor (sigma-70 family)